VGQIVDPALVSVLNGRDYAAFEVVRRNAANTAYEFAAPAWLDQANTFAEAQVVEGSVTVRQSGGVPGTDDLVLSCDGADSRIESKTGRVFVRSAAGGAVFEDQAVGRTALGHINSADRVCVTSIGQFSFANANNDATVGHDTGLARDSAGVAKVTNGGAGSGTLLGNLRPVHQADGAAAADTIYFSTTSGKLAYKDSGGAVHDLY
jgi:hypothetical protein